MASSVGMQGAGRFPGEVQTMNLLFYASLNNRNARKVFGIMQLLEKEVSLEFHRNIDLFTQRLRQPAKDIAAVVIFTANMEDIDDMCSICHFFEDIPVILVLPENGQEYIRKGHLLRPRFLTFAESSLQEIGAVLNNMLHKVRIAHSYDEYAEAGNSIGNGVPFSSTGDTTPLK
jgi:hypothetical protein